MYLGLFKGFWVKGKKGKSSMNNQMNTGFVHRYGLRGLHIVIFTISWPQLPVVELS